jgi:hypothetical protein
LIALTAKALKRIISGILIPEIIKRLMTAKEFKPFISLWKEFYDPTSSRTDKSTLGPHLFPKRDCLALSPHMSNRTRICPRFSTPSTMPPLPLNHNHSSPVGLPPRSLPIIAARKSAPSPERPARGGIIPGKPIHPFGTAGVNSSTFDVGPPRHALSSHRMAILTPPLKEHSGRYPSVTELSVRDPACLDVLPVGSTTPLGMHTDPSSQRLGLGCKTMETPGDRSPCSHLRGMSGIPPVSGARTLRSFKTPDVFSRKPPSTWRESSSLAGKCIPWLYSSIRRPPMNRSTIRMFCTPSHPFVSRRSPLASRLTRIIPQVIPGLFPRGLSFV